MNRGHLAAAVAALTIALGLPSAAGAATFNFPLQGWWPMNEGSGQVVHDWSFHGNNGYLGSTPQADDQDPTWIPGVFSGSALRFDGVDDRVTIPDSASLEPQKLTVAAWVRQNGWQGAFRYIMSKNALACDRSSYGLDTGANGGLEFYVSDSNQQYTVNFPDFNSIWDGNWHNVAGTFDGNTVKLYIDGKLVGSTAAPGVTIDYSLPVQTGMIGSYENGDACGHNGNLVLNGDIDGVQLWSQALPVDTIWNILKSLFTTSR
jgi:hypothetical protein